MYMTQPPFVSLSSPVRPVIVLFSGHALKIFLRTFAAGIGFFLSAGWEWLPAMHPLWLQQDMYSTIPVNPLDVLGNVSEFILVKSVMLLLFCFLFEKMCLVMLFRPFGETGSLKTFKNVLFSAAAGKGRFRVFLPFAIAQLFGAGLLLLLNLSFQLPLVHLAPWLIASITAIFGLLWFFNLAMLPLPFSCLGYGLALCCGMLLAWVGEAFSPAGMRYLRLAAPFAALPLLFVALPSARSLKKNILTRQRSRVRAVSRSSPSGHPTPVSLLTALPKTALPYSVVGLFTLMYSLQILFDCVSGCLVTPQGTLIFQGAGRPLLMLSGQTAGAFATVWLIGYRRGHPLLIPMLGLALFGGGALLGSLFRDAPEQISVFLISMVTGGCAAFGIALLGAYMFHTATNSFRTMASALILVNLFGYFGGYAIWTLAGSLHDAGLTYYGMYMQLLALITVLGMLCLYALRQPVGDLLETGEEQAPLSPPAPEKTTPLPQRLTPREREIVGLVQQGMKNLEISVRLNITEATLRVHLRRVYRKLGVQGRPALRNLSLPPEDALPRADGGKE